MLSVKISSVKPFSKCWFHGIKSGDELLSVDGKEVTMQVKTGQKVIYSKYAGTEVKMDGTDYIIVKQEDILAIIK